MKQIRINNGVHRNDVFNGTFSLVTNYRKSYTPGPKSGKVEILDVTGKRVGVWVNPEDIAYLSDGAVVTEEETGTVEEISDDELNTIILDRFDSLSKMTKGIVAGNIRSLIVSGAPGVGKTFILEHDFKKAERRDQISKYTFMSGNASPVGLYQALWNHKNDGEVLVLDDLDSVFYDSVALNVLKAALDSGETRSITWATDSRVLREEEIPTSFDFNGSVVFITNEDFDRRIAKQDKLAPHLSALVSRSMYLDLAIHSNRAILIRIKQIIYGTDMLDKKGFSDAEKHMMVTWMEDNMDKIRVLSLRTALQLASLIRMSPTDWERTAKVTLLRPERSF